MNKLITIGITLVLILTVGFFLFQKNEPQKTTSKQTNTSTEQQSIEESPKIGFRAPSFSLTSLDNMTYSLKQTKGKPTVMFFWASWCPNCEALSPELERLYEKYKAEMEVYSVNLTSQDSFDRATRFAEEHQFSFPVLLDEDGTVAQAYRVIGTPTTYFIDKNGIIVDIVQGAANPAQFTEKFEKLVNTN
ncbi:TlpA family protein disulfide reductase [Priestia taiwanensis]|uniref:Thioredoxin n=1 Tax=Priestia taiwanensis TaxID=1347902 RepID=A0A917EUA4_9BACI|nr:TlpA disulfide reductase family protein [Priestia taiwanensis]MBM7365238.1 peroxiredoxin [Priestia taiwanensis]GGE85472.1 thioredoxin [Priestia taiwanensis]